MFESSSSSSVREGTEQSAHFLNGESLTGRAIATAARYSRTATHGIDKPASVTLQPYTIETNWRRLKTPMTLDGHRVTKYLAPTIIEWLDHITGEIISDEEARKDPLYRFPARASEKALQREFVLNSLRPEPRKFALFVLSFRNRRRGITPGIDKLIKWYSVVTGKRTNNIRRYVQPLEEVGILLSESQVGPLWSKDDQGRNDRAEEAESFERFSRMMLADMAERKDILNLIASGNHRKPDWMVESERSR